MKKIVYFFLIILIFIFIFDTKILNYFLAKKVSSLKEYDITFNISKLDYFNSELEIDRIEIKKNKNLETNIFKANLIIINFNYESLFSNLVILDNVAIIDPILYFEVKDLDRTSNTKITIGNLDLLDNSPKDNFPKIYPPKKRDKNFLISKLLIKNSKAIIKYPKDIRDLKINLSEIVFKKVGNAGKKRDNNFQHYKDVMKLILSDIFFRIPDYNLRNLIKEMYKIK